jgi:DNA-directed RNA polymerase subunit RPC12/RpoP
MIDEKVKIKCFRCSKMFRERAQRIRKGYQMQCPHCMKLLTFDSSSDDNNIRRALKSAKELRAVLEAAQESQSQR